MNFLLVVLKYLKFNCFMLQSQKIKCLVLSKYIRPFRPYNMGIMEKFSTIDVAQDIGVAF